MLPPTGCIGDLNPQECAPCRAHKQKARGAYTTGFSKFCTLLSLALGELEALAGSGLTGLFTLLHPRIATQEPFGL